MTRDQVMDLLPDHVAGRLSEAQSEAVRAYLEDCAECRAEAALLEALAEAPPVAPPPGLEDRVVAAALDAQRRQSGVGGGEGPGVTAIRRRGVPSWAMGAAAVLVLALGTPLLMDRMSDSEGGLGDPVASVSEEFEEPDATVWASEDGLIAGAPVLETLTDEELALLLEEFEG